MGVSFNDPRRKFLPIQDWVLGQWAELLAIGHYIGGAPTDAFESAYADCAQAHGAKFQGVAAGALGDAGTYSFCPTKNLGAVGDAGAVICQQAGIAEKVRSLAQYGWTTKYKICNAGGRNSWMDPLQAAVLLTQLPRLDEWNRNWRDICRIYAGALPSGRQLVHSAGEHFVGHLAVAIAPTPAARANAQLVLSEHQIGYDVHYPILDCDQPAWARLDRSSEEPCPLALALSGRILSLPCFPELTDSEIGEVTDAIRAF